MSNNEVDTMIREATDEQLILLSLLSIRELAKRKQLIEAIKP